MPAWPPADPKQLKDQNSVSCFPNLLFLIKIDYELNNNSF
jgi:hypothetical protein